MPKESEATRITPPFSAQIGEARLRLGLSQRSLGAQIRTPKRPNGVWNTYVGQIEKGGKVPSDEVVLKLAQVLQLDCAELLLAAYRARTESAEVQTLFAKVERALQQKLGGKGRSGTDRAGKEATSFRTDLVWLKEVAMALNKRGTPEVSRLLNTLVGLNKRQWRAIEQTLETIVATGS